MAVKKRPEPEQEPEDVASRGWHFDRRIPIAILVAFAVQSGSALWWASKLDSRVGVLESMMSEAKSLFSRVTTVENSASVNAQTLSRAIGALETISTRVGNVETRAAGVEGKVDQINAGVTDLKNTLNSITEVQVKPNPPGK